MYFGTAVDSINGKEYINYDTFMWACIRTLNYVGVSCCCMGWGGGGHVLLCYRKEEATKY